jgi:hypothetical protein
MTIFVQYAVRRSSQCSSATLSEPEAGVARHTNQAANGSAKGGSVRDDSARADFATHGFSGVPYLEERAELTLFFDQGAHEELQFLFGAFVAAD